MRLDVLSLEVLLCPNVSEFHVSMGSYNDAELCELVGLYLLDLLTK